MKTIQGPMDYYDLSTILEDIHLPDGRSFRITDKEEGWCLQIVYLDTDINTGVKEEQRSRKWYISPYSTTSEVVRTVWKALNTSYEHYLGEHFRYKDARIFSPHYDVEKLVKHDDLRQDGRVPLEKK